jgi:hypothetical protein
MNLKRFNEGLQWELERAGKTIPNRIQLANHCIKLCRDVLSLFRKEISINGFTDIDAEVEFFKDIKSLPMSRHIYFSQVRSFEIQFPKGNADLQRRFIKKKLNRINRFFRENRDFVAYIESDSSHFDEQYYTREYLDSFPHIPSTFNFRDPEFNTARDVLLAEYKAYNLFVSYLQDRLIDGSKSPNGQSTALHHHISLQWTAPKSALTELIYALHYNRVINNGKADIKEIAMGMQQLFHFELGDFYKIYAEIKDRRISRTKFLDELATGLESRMDRSEE